MKLFKKKNKVFYAIANGKTVALETVPDEVFANKMMGDGIAILPSDNHIYAPCVGTVTMIMDETKHAIGIENEDGIGILIHIGLDTVHLSGEGFEVFVRVGDKVKPGDLLVSYNKQIFEKHHIHDVTMMVIVDAKEYHISKYYTDQEVVASTSKVIEYQK